MTQQTIYFGRFIDTPTSDELRIRTGAVLVSDKNGRGTILKADWTVNGPNDAASKLGVEAPVVTTSDDGFFFPGFIGEPVSASCLSINLNVEPIRYPCPCFSISQRRHLWQVHSAGLAHHVHLSPRIISWQSEVTHVR